MPEYFFEVAASSTGKYHPKYALGDGGLIRHTKAAVAIANDLLSLEMYNKYSSDEKDIILASLILHDGMKHGKKKSVYTVAEHPKVVADWIIGNAELNSMLPSEQLNLLSGALASHMGQWNTAYKTKEEILPKPKTAIQKMVHMCDYLASRKYLEFDFGDGYYNPDNFRNTYEDELKSIIEKIVSICKSKIENGEDKNVAYEIIASSNGGKKNPNSIPDLDVAKTILQKLGG